MKEFSSTGRPCAEVENLKSQFYDNEMQKDKKYVQDFQITNSHSLIEKSTKLKETVFNRNNGKSNQNIHKKVSFGVSVIF